MRTQRARAGAGAGPPAGPAAGDRAPARAGGEEDQPAGDPARQPGRAGRATCPTRAPSSPRCSCSGAGGASWPTSSSNRPGSWRTGASRGPRRRCGPSSRGWPSRPWPDPAARGRRLGAGHQPGGHLRGARRPGGARERQRRFLGGGRLARSAAEHDRGRGAQRGRGPAGPRLPGGRASATGRWPAWSAPCRTSPRAEELRAHAGRPLPDRRGPRAAGPHRSPRAASTSTTRRSSSPGRGGRPTSTPSSGCCRGRCRCWRRRCGCCPTDESLRSALADGLGQSGRHEEARTLLLELIEEAGWRRSRKRASLHERLGRVARAAGDLPFALEHLEQASSMDVSNPEILGQLAEVAEATGAAERAERAYRALLMLKRKDTAPAEAPPAARAAWRSPRCCCACPIWRSKRDQTDQAAELLDSALAAAIGDAAEAEKLQRALLERGAHEALARLFEKRREHTAGSPAEGEVYAQMAESLRVQGRLEDAFEAQILAIQAAPDREHLQEAAVEAGPRAEQGRRAGQAAARPGRTPAPAPRRRGGHRPAAAGGPAVRDRPRRCRAGARAVPAGRGDRDRDRPRSGAGWGAWPTSAATWPNVAAIAGLLEAARRPRPPPRTRRPTRSTGLPPCSCPGRRRARRGSPAWPLRSRRASRWTGPWSWWRRRACRRADLVTILPLYERVARASGDERMLFDYLERRATSASVTVAEVREAVDLALALGRDDRVEALLLRLADLGGTAARAQGRGGLGPARARAAQEGELATSRAPAGQPRSGGRGAGVRSGCCRWCAS